MTKALLDILEGERNLVQNIDALSDHIKFTSDRRIELLMRCMCEVDLEYERHYLAHLQEDIDRMNEGKLACQKRLADTHHELADYIKRNIFVLKGE